MVAASPDRISLPAPCYCGPSPFFAADESASGAASSIRHTGPSSESGPSNSRNVGASLFTSHTLISGGCFPTSGATLPATPSIFVFTM